MAFGSISWLVAKAVIPAAARPAPGVAVRCGVAVVLLLVTFLLLAKPFAYASPHDQTWVPGIYDGADGDDEVIQAMSGVDSNSVAVPAPVPPADQSQAVVAEADRDCCHRPLPSGGRGPPNSAALAPLPSSQLVRPCAVPPDPPVDLPLTAPQLPLRPFPTPLARLLPGSGRDRLSQIQRPIRLHALMVLDVLDHSRTANAGRRGRDS